MGIVTKKVIQDFLEKNQLALLPTQSRLSVPIINRICQKMSHNIKFDEIKVVENLVIDGHHRYLSSLIVGIDIGITATRKTSSTKTFDWQNIELDENDWDTQSKIEYLNKLDAEYNHIDVETINNIIRNK